MTDGLLALMVVGWYGLLVLSWFGLSYVAHRRLL